MVFKTHIRSGTPGDSGALGSLSTGSLWSGLVIKWLEVDSVLWAP